MHVGQSLVRFATFVELKDFVYSTLCGREQLEIGAFPMTQAALRRRGSFCGMIFSVHGPRNVLFNAVWENERNTIRFYTSAGERFQTTRLAPFPASMNVFASI